MMGLEGLVQEVRTKVSKLWPARNNEATVLHGLRQGIRPLLTLSAFKKLSNKNYPSLLFLMETKNKESKLEKF